MIGVTRFWALPAVVLLIATSGLMAQNFGTASGKFGDKVFEGDVKCWFGETLEVLTPDGGRTDNDGDGFAMMLRGEKEKGFIFTMTVDEQTYTGFAQGGLVGGKLKIAAPELSYLDGNGTVATFIDVDCSG